MRKLANSALFLVVAFCALGTFAAEPAAGPAVISFKDWKADKIQQVNIKIAQDKMQIEGLKSRRNSEPRTNLSLNVQNQIRYYENRITQETWNLDVANDLSVTDYVALYLSSHPSKYRFQEAATQLSPHQIAEILEVYSETLGASPVPAVMGTASNKAILTKNPTASLQSPLVK